MNRQGVIIASVLVQGLLYSAVAMAESPKFQGYFSQAVLHSGNNPYYSDEAGTNFNYRELGFNLSWQASDRVRFSGQLLSRKAGELEDGNPRIDFLLVDYNFYATASTSAGVRLGRIKNHYGIYNTSRDIPHGRPGIFVPQSIYFDSMRSAVVSSDGADFYLSLSNSLADISADIYGGKVDVDNRPFEYQFFQADIPGKFSSLDGYGVNILLEPKVMPNLSAGFTAMQIFRKYSDAPNFTPSEQVGAELALGENHAVFPVYITNMEVDAMMRLYSMQYAPGNWIISAEFLVVDIELDDIEILHMPPLNNIFRNEFVANAYYVQVEWMASNNFSIYSRYEELYNDKNDKDGEKYMVTNGGNPVTQYNKAFTIGARRYFTSNLSVSAEYSVNEGAAFINGQDIDYMSLEKNWDLFIAQLSYHF